MDLAKNNVVFVGQGPNKAAWQYGLDTKIRRMGRDLMTPVNFPNADQRHAAAVKYAEAYCARVAITGSIGQRLASLAGVDRLDLYRYNDRRNLNARWNGKQGKGDKFNRPEGIRTAYDLLQGAWTHHVLLGGEVCACFDFKRPEWLEAKDLWAPGPDGKDVKKRFLLFPHPSAINAWWNEEFNRFRAGKRLREFLEEAAS